MKTPTINFDMEKLQDFPAGFDFADIDGNDDFITDSRVSGILLKFTGAEMAIIKDAYREYSQALGYPDDTDTQQPKMRNSFNMAVVEGTGDIKAALSSAAWIIVRDNGAGEAHQKERFWSHRLETLKSVNETLKDFLAPEDARFLKESENETEKCWKLSREYKEHMTEVYSRSESIGPSVRKMSQNRGCGL